MYIYHCRLLYPLVSYLLTAYHSVFDFYTYTNYYLSMSELYQKSTMSIWEEVEGFKTGTFEVCPKFTWNVKLCGDTYASTTV
jgi:hypothetical protein